MLSVLRSFPRHAVNTNVDVRRQQLNVTRHFIQLHHHCDHLYGMKLFNNYNLKLFCEFAIFYKYNEFSGTMVELNCPLCCNETFTSRLSLKTHILNILENICCRSCDEKFETLANLAKHLENDCGGGDLIISKGISKHQDISNKNALGEDSILAKALLGGLPTDNQEEENLPYYCQMCSMHLDNVEEHLKYYHDGQEVIMVIHLCQNWFSVHTKSFINDFY